MKLEVGMYVRTPYGIDKIKDIVLNGNLYEDSGLYLEKGIKLVCGKEEMKSLKASHNIIDLIEIGDYVNGREVVFLDDDFTKEIAIYETDLTTRDFEGRYNFKRIKKEDIKSIVTKEQMEAMQYKVV